MALLKIPNTNMKIDFDEDEDIVKETPYLHVYGQGAWHDDVVIVGNHEALIQLHKAITRAITKGEGFSDSVFCGDGEGYKIVVKDVGIGDLSDIGLPYSDEICRL